MIDFERLHNIIEMLEEKRINQLMVKAELDEDISMEEVLMMRDYYYKHKDKKDGRD